MKGSLAQLPNEPVDRFTAPFHRFVRIEASAGAVLLVCAVVAMILANTGFSSAYLAFWDTSVGLAVEGIDFARSLKHWINDALMTLFFFIVSLELKREMVLGELRNPRLAILPLAGALGGMVAPAALYLWLAGDGPGAHGWGTALSTDTAFVLGCLAVLGRRVPGSLRLFLLALAIFDDIGAILVVAFAYGRALDWGFLAAAAAGFAIVAVLARLGVRNMAVYFALGGCLWLAIDASGVHATLTGVILGLMTPARSWVSDDRLHAIFDRVVAYPPGDHWSGDTPGRRDLRRARVAAREALSPIERLEMSLHPWVAFAILPLFALANAGVPIRPDELEARLAMAVFFAFVVGKPVGILLFSSLAVKSGLATRPGDLSWGMVAAGGALAGIGFTMALFIAELAFDAGLLNSVKLGVLAASVTAASVGLAMLGWVTRSARG